MQPPTSAYPCPACTFPGDGDPACAACFRLGEVWLIDELCDYPGALQRVLSDLALTAGEGKTLPGARLVECGGRPRVVYGTDDGVRLAALTALELSRIRRRVEYSLQLPLFDLDATEDADLQAADTGLD